jgi:hypothetical protein
MKDICLYLFHHLPSLPSSSTSVLHPAWEAAVTDQTMALPLGEMLLEGREGLGKWMMITTTTGVDRSGGWKGS